MQLADMPRLQPYAGLVSRFRYAPHGSSPNGVDPRIAPWFWAFYDECANPGDLACRRYAARQLTLCLPSSLQDPPLFDEHGHIYPRPQTYADRLCAESAALHADR